MYFKIEDKLADLPAQYSEELLPSIRQEFIKTAKTIVVLDDDPTGTQTCYDVVVLTSWTVALISEELNKKPSVLFILTNSRSLPETQAIQLALDIAKNIKEASRKSGREIIIISRSDSTLRGHFPAEVGAVSRALEMEDASWILIPAFIEGGRFTIDDIHYIVENHELVPVAETPFAKDVVFGYRHSDLKEWVEEKTKGSVKATEVMSLSIHDIRFNGPQGVCEKLIKNPAQIWIVNAAGFRDLEVFAMGVILAEKSGKKFLYRSSATFVPIRAGMASGKIFTPEKTDMQPENGSLIMVGSHVPKTTTQLEWLVKQGKHEVLEINVREILNSNNAFTHVERIVKQTDRWLSSGRDVVIYTSRQLETGKDAESNLKINSLVSGFLVSIMRGLTVRPKFIVAKGGITSSDLASKGLSSERALILGQVIPGVPVWQMDKNSKFPEIMYVVFPGNVGDHKALVEVCEKISMSNEGGGTN